MAQLFTVTETANLYEAADTNSTTLQILRAHTPRLTVEREEPGNWSFVTVLATEKKGYVRSCKIEPIATS